MSGVHTYVKKPPRHQTPPPPTQPQQQTRNGGLDRAGAVGLKVSSRDAREMRKSLFQQSALPPTLAPVYDPFPAAPRYSHPNNGFHQRVLVQPVEQDGFVAQDEHPPPAEGNVFDDTITSDLEDTRSDIPHNGHEMDDRGRMNDENYDLQAEEGYQHRNARHELPLRDHRSKHFHQPGLQHKQSSPDLHQQQNAYAPPPIRSAGRFEQSVHGPRQTIATSAYHASNELDQQAVTSSPQRDGVAMFSDDGDDTPSQGRHQEDRYDESESGGESDLPIQDNDRHIQQEAGDGFEPRTDGVDSTQSLTAREEVERALEARASDLKRNIKQLDYDEETLKSMTYADLKKESWDSQTAEKPSTQLTGRKRPNPTQTQSSEFTFEECMEHLVNDEPVEVQMQTFEEIPIQEFEQAGEYFIGKFGEIMQKIMAARKKKRDMVSKFEGEIETREKAVRNKSENLDKQMRDMKTGGEGVLRGKV